MEIIKTPIQGVFILEFKSFVDDRGSFSEKFNQQTLLNLGVDFKTAQVNYAVNVESCIMRGLHFQNQPYAQAKIIMCLRGSIMDCALDIQKDSETFGQYFLCELSEGDNRALYVPEGMAHGYLTLKPGTDVMYMTSNYYNKKSEGGVRFNDPLFSIQWPKVEKMIVCERDRNWPLFEG